MEFRYSKTEKVAPRDGDSADVRIESNKTHHVLNVKWDHVVPETTKIKVTNHPLEVEANSYDGVNYHQLKFNLVLNHPLATLDNAYYKVEEDGFSIHIPREDFIIVQKNTMDIPLH